jgi:hypothetical protein
MAVVIDQNKNKYKITDIVLVFSAILCGITLIFLSPKIILVCIYKKDIDIRNIIMRENNQIQNNFNINNNINRNININANVDNNRIIYA